MSHGHRATEARTLDEEANRVATVIPIASARIERLRRVARLPERPRVLDLGCASGVYVAAFEAAGCECIGLEPAQSALANAATLLRESASSGWAVGGLAESIPFRDETFDVVHASSVIEHVVGLDETLHEISRVLRPGGVFWFSSASSMCPAQAEIRGFPLFGWYPNRVKLRVMEWARTNRPELIGHTQTPAVNWFTPRKARRMLRSHGFTKVHDRWELRQPHEVSSRLRPALRMARGSPAMKFLADVLMPGCSYAAVK